MTIKPQRIQRKRTKGWKKPDNTICVTRGTYWGNPFIVKPDMEAGKGIGFGYFAVPTVEDAIDCYKEMIDLTEGMEEKIVKNLRGKHLACYCKLTEPCHADILLEIANGN